MVVCVPLLVSAIIGWKLVASITWLARGTYERVNPGAFAGDAH